MTDASDGKRDFFISYTSSDEPWAEWLAWAVEEAGWPVWFQKWDFRGNFVLQMDRSNDLSDRTIGILSARALDSKQVQAEWDARRAVDPRNEQESLILIKIGSCEVPGLLKPFIWLDLTETDPDTAKAELVAWLKRQRCKPGKAPPLPSGPSREKPTQQPRFPSAPHFTGRDELLEEICGSGKLFHRHLATLVTKADDILQDTVLNFHKMLKLRSNERSDAVAPEIPIAYLSRHRRFAEKKPREFNSFADAFTFHHERVLLLGEPGAGKTTTILTFAREKAIERLSNPHAHLPIFAPIATWRRGEAIPDWIARVTGLAASHVRQQIITGRSLLLLDGLDELPAYTVDQPVDQSGSNNQRVEFMKELAELKRTLMVVTCRSEDYDEIIETSGKRLNLEGAVLLKALIDEQIQEYLCPDHLTLWDALNDDAMLLDMARIPLILSLLMVAYRKAGDRARELRDFRTSPSDLRDKIFEKYVHERYEFEVERVGGPLSFSLEEIYEIIGKAMLEQISENEDDKMNTIDILLIKGIIGETADCFVELGRHLYFFLPSLDPIYRFVRPCYSLKSCLIQSKTAARQRTPMKDVAVFS